MRYFVVVLLALGLTGCAYGSANVVRVQGKDVMVLGAEGFIHVQNASATIYRSMDCKTKSCEKIKYPARPNIVENGAASNISIGSSKTAIPYEDDATSEVTTPGGSTSNGQVTK